MGLSARLLSTSTAPMALYMRGSSMKTVNDIAALRDEQNAED
jgi:hypothetical protein